MQILHTSFLPNICHICPNAAIVQLIQLKSSLLLQATSESLFKKMTDEDIKKFVPQYVNTLDKVRDAAGINNES
jgi:hypothetical protein